MEFLDFKGLRYFYENIPKDYVGILEPKIEGYVEDTILYLDEDTGIVANNILKISPVFATVEEETLILNI